MVKFSRYFSVIFAVLLLVSLVAPGAAAATVGGNTSYTATVSKTSTFTSYYNIGDNRVQHSYGTSNSIDYSNASYTSPYFVPSGFPSAYSSGLNSAFVQEGFNYQVSISGRSGKVTVPAHYSSGLYAAAFSYTYGNATWNVKVNSTVVSSGSFSSAPRTLTIVAHLA